MYVYIYISIHIIYICIYRHTINTCIDICIDIPYWGHDRILYMAPKFYTKGVRSPSNLSEALGGTPVRGVVFSGSCVYLDKYLSVSTYMSVRVCIYSVIMQD